jgi:hypothetical protein
MNIHRCTLLVCAALLLAGCVSNTSTGPTPAQQAQVSQEIANLKQLLLEANGITQVLAATGVLTPPEQALANGLYASAVAALNQASAEDAAGQSIDVIDVTLAAVNGYLQQISQVHNAGRTRLGKGA